MDDAAMRDPPRILVVDDNADNRDILEARLGAQGYDATAADGEEALAAARELLPDLILLDVMMPKLDGIEVCRRLKADPSLPFMPIILVTAKADPQDVVAGLEAGADEYLTKPVDHAALVARVRSMLRIKALHDTVQAAGGGARRLEPDARAARGRAGRRDRAGRPPQALPLAAGRRPDRLGRGRRAALESHRREVTVVFCDLRGFTAFAETAEPEEVMGVLREYHAALGALIHRFEGTLERFAGDGLMVLFNDPGALPRPAVRAVRMAVGDARRGRELRRLAGPRLRARLRGRHRPRLRHPGPDRLRGPLRLRRDRRRRQPRGAAVRRGPGRPDPGQPAGGRGRREHRRARAAALSTSS